MLEDQAGGFFESVSVTRKVFVLLVGVVGSVSAYASQSKTVPQDAATKERNSLITSRTRREGKGVVESGGDILDKIDKISRVRDAIASKLARMV